MTQKAEKQKKPVKAYWKFKGSDQHLESQFEGTAEKLISLFVGRFLGLGTDADLLAEARKRWPNGLPAEPATSEGSLNP